MAQSKTSLLSSGKKFMVGGGDNDVLPRFNYSTGAGWCKKRDRKKANRGKGQTSGSTKGITCQASTFDRYCATTSRSYKHKNYINFIEKARLRDGTRR
jgi:hypothetical protein